MVKGMLIERWTKHPVRTVKPLHSIRHARELMEQHRINQPCLGVKGRRVGIVRDRDLCDVYPSVFEVPRRRATKIDIRTRDLEMQSRWRTLADERLTKLAARFPELIRVPGGRLQAAKQDADMTAALHAGFDALERELARQHEHRRHRLRLCVARGRVIATNERHSS